MICLGVLPCQAENSLKAELPPLHTAQIAAASISRRVPFTQSIQKSLREMVEKQANKRTKTDLKINKQLNNLHWGS